METNSSFYGTEKINKIFFKIAPPVMLAQLIQALYNIVDSYFVARISESAMEALSLVFPGQNFIAHCYEGEKPLLKDMVHPGEDALVLIGPEGDFSEEEVRKAAENGFIPISLGKSRLRTETAALVACHILNLQNQ